MQSEKIPQSYLFVGPESIGKFTIAKLFADALIFGESKLNSTRLSKVENNQDLEILLPEIIEKKGIIKIRDFETKRVREAQKNLTLFPAIGKYRVLIINDAQKLNVTAQNSLLKTLEEPNETSVIILVTNQEEKILGTIKSRCRKTIFNLVGLEDIKSGFKDKVSGELLDKLAIYSIGKPGEAKRMAENESVTKERNEMIEDLKKIVAMNITEKISLAEQYSKNLPETLKRIELWMWFLRIQAYRNLGDEINLKKYYRIIDRLEEVLEELKKTGLNSRLILENLLLNL